MFFEIINMVENDKLSAPGHYMFFWRFLQTVHLVTNSPLALLSLQSLKFRAQNDDIRF